MPVCALFDVNNKKLLTPYFNHIGCFMNTSEYDEPVALVDFYIRDEYGDVIAKIEFYIRRDDYDFL